MWNYFITTILILILKDIHEKNKNLAKAIRIFSLTLQNISTLCLDRTIDVLDWNSLIDERTKISDLLVVPNVEVSSIKH